LVEYSVLLLPGTDPHPAIPSATAVLPKLVAEGGDFAIPGPSNISGEIEFGIGVGAVHHHAFRFSPEGQS
jgi:hypothetical protein